MRVPNGVLAAKCSDKWIGLRSPVTSAKPTTSDDATVLANRSVMPTERSSKYSVCKVSIVTRPWIAAAGTPPIIGRSAAH